MKYVYKSTVQKNGDILKYIKEMDQWLQQS